MKAETPHRKPSLINDIIKTRRWLSGAGVNSLRKNPPEMEGFWFLGRSFMSCPAFVDNNERRFDTEDTSVRHS